MRSIYIPASVFVVCSTFAGAAAANDIGLGLTTFGVSLEGSLSLPSGPGNLDLRGVLYVPINADLDAVDIDDDYTLTGDLDTGAIALLADYYFGDSGFRGSAGLFIGPDEVASGTLTGPETFGGALVMDNTAALMLAAGYKHRFTDRFWVSGEVGAILSGFSVETDSTDPDVITDVDEINDELDDLPFYPYLAVTAGFSF